MPDEVSFVAELWLSMAKKCLCPYCQKIIRDYERKYGEDKELLSSLRKAKGYDKTKGI